MHRPKDDLAVFSHISNIQSMLHWSCSFSMCFSIFVSDSHAMLLPLALHIGHIIISLLDFHLIVTENASRIESIWLSVVLWPAGSLSAFTLLDSDSSHTILGLNSPTDIRGAEPSPSMTDSEDWSMLLCKSIIVSLIELTCWTLGGLSRVQLSGFFWNEGS